jgi:exonuclease III
LRPAAVRRCREGSVHSLSHLVTESGTFLYFFWQSGSGANIINPLENLSFTSINCNSLNLMSTQENYELKLNAVSKLNSDIVFLCDIRLGEVNNQSSVHRISSTLLKGQLKHHDMYVNSTQNKRGVAILVNRSLNCKLVQEFKDQNENLLLIKFERNGGEFVLGSVYGPNNTDRIFYNDITSFLARNNGIPTILASDWNTTWDNSPPENNIDVANMVRSPNMANGKILKSMAENFDLTDPFRILHPTKIGYSYAPFGGVRTNRSRLDFFLISTSLINNTKQCWISPSHLSNMFDHKPIHLTFCENKYCEQTRNKTLKNWFLDDPLVKMSTELSALQVYSYAICPDHEDNVPVLATIRNAINQLTANFLSEKN